MIPKVLSVKLSMLTPQVLVSLLDHPDDAVGGLQQRALSL